MDEAKVRKVLKIAKEPISMETPIGDDEDSHLGDFIEDNTISSPIENATAEGLREATREVLDNLTEREAKVLKCDLVLICQATIRLKKLVSNLMLPVSVSAKSKPKHCVNYATLLALNIYAHFGK